MLSNQGCTEQYFRAGLGLVRLAESTFTVTAYYFAGMFATESVGLLPYILPSLVVGIPLGIRVIRHVRPETFRRVCMSFDAWVVGYGISTLLRQLHLIETNAAFSVLAAVGLIDIWLLYRFFRHQTRTTWHPASGPGARHWPARFRSRPVPTRPHYPACATAVPRSRTGWRCCSRVLPHPSIRLCRAR